MSARVTLPLRDGATTMVAPEALALWWSLTARGITLRAEGEGHCRLVVRPAEGLSDDDRRGLQQHAEDLYRLWASELLASSRKDG